MTTLNTAARPAAHHHRARRPHRRGLSKVYGRGETEVVALDA